MKKVLLVLCAVMLVFGMVGTGSATIVSIDFDDGTAGQTVGSFYPDVTFSNAVWNENFGYAGSTPPLGITAEVYGDWEYSFGYENAIRAEFSVPLISVSITGIDVGLAGMEMDAFDSGGVLIDQAFWYGTDVGSGQYMTISVASPLIASVLLYQPDPGYGDGMIFDNLVYDTGTVPEPATLLLLGFGLVGLAGFRRKF